MRLWESFFTARSWNENMCIWLRAYFVSIAPRLGEIRDVLEICILAHDPAPCRFLLMRVCVPRRPLIKMSKERRVMTGTSMDPMKELPHAYVASQSDRLSFDAKVVNCVVSFCVLLGLVLLVAGAVVYSQIEDDSDKCPCSDRPDGSTACCFESPSVCSECQCDDDSLGSIIRKENDAFCTDYERNEGDSAAAISVAATGVVVCVVSAAMLVTMRWCKEWSEKHLHVRYPPVIPVGGYEDTI